MKLPKNLLSNTYTKPRIFLCEVNKEKICQLETFETKASFKFNAYSELSFEVSRTHNDLLYGVTKEFEYYDKIEAPRLIFVEGFGYFEIQSVSITSDGIKEAKQISANSLEYSLSTKYLENFYINKGTVDSLEVLNATNANKIKPITLYNPSNTKLSLLHLIFEKDYGFWEIGHVDTSLKKLSRSFEIDRMSIYDFIMNELCPSFNCYIVFDTINNKINFYAESLTQKFIGDGETTNFVLTPPFSDIATISVDGYKTTEYTYKSNSGIIIFNTAPEDDVVIEVVDAGLTDWETDVFITFDNLAQETNVNYNVDDIKTVLTVTYGDDLDIREANLGLPYIIDLSYFCSRNWMGVELYMAYKKYLKAINSNQSEYTNNSQNMLYYASKIDYEENRLSLGYSEASVNSETVGTYYVRSGINPNYYYTEVSLPEEYNVNTTYYSTNTTNVNEEKVSDLYTVLKKYFNNENVDGESSTSWKTDFNELQDAFSFMSDYTYNFNYLYNKLSAVTNNRTKNSSVETALLNFLSKMWDEIGRTPLKTLYYKTYKTLQTTNIDAGWSKTKNENYGYYYPVTIYIKSINNAIKKRNSAINEYEEKYNELAKANSKISNDLSISNHFTQEQMLRLRAFLREDEIHFDDIVETEITSASESFTLKKSAIASGKIELSKISQPQLSFSMSMANIYALPEFEPIIDQFQLGNVIKIFLRSSYIKQSRLMQVDLNFDDLSDFNCEFGDLTHLRSQSNIHADLLSQAISAGKSVANSANLWTSGADKATETDLKIQKGLLDAVEAIKSTEGVQNAYIDKYGFHLEEIDPDTGEVGDKRIWMVNNQIVFTDDGFKTSQAALGEFKFDNTTYYGLIAQAVIAGYIEGSTIKGGTINIGDGAFKVDEDGTVTMSAENNKIDGYATTGRVEEIQDAVDDINNSKMYRVEIITNDATIISTSTDSATITCKVYSWDDDITDTLDASLFNWRRTSTNSEQDDIWNGMAEHQGKKFITINANDVIENSSFTCEVELPG